MCTPEIGSPDRRHGTGKVTLLLNTVTDNHCLLKNVVGFHNDIDNGLIADCDYLIVVTNARELKRDTCRYGNLVSTVNVCSSTEGALSYDHNTSSDNRLTAFIYYFTADIAVLSIDLGGAKKCSKKYRQDTDRF